MLLTVLAVLATTLGLTSVLLLWQYASTFRRYTEAEASTVARTIGGTIQTVMLNGRGDLASEVIDNLRRAAGIRRIEVYRVNGTEAFKDYVTLMDVVGTRNGRGEGELAQELYRNVVQHRGRPGRPRRLTDPHLISAVATGGSLSREETLAGESVLTYFLPLRNDRPCQQCHEADSKVRGVVVLSVSTTPIWVGVRQGSLLLGASMGLTALAIAAGLLVSLRRLVLRPLETLVQALRSDDPGAALATVPPSTSAEFTTLLRTLRDSVERVKAAQAAMSQSEKLMSLGQLAAGVAHELNNPLAVMTGHAALLLAANPDGPHAQRATKIARAAERCARIVRNFLDLARQHPPERRPVQMNRVVEDALEILAYSLRVNGVELVTELAADLPELAADPHQLHQVVVNLVTNAEHAMREVRGPRRLTIVTRQPTFNRVILEILDTGPGMPPELQRRIFEPFFTTKPPGQGTGLGLPLCRGIVEGHGGTLTVESAPGHGTTFRVELPAEAPAAPAPPEGAATAAPRARVLVVDDEPDVAEVLADLLAADGHEVDVAHAGPAALARAKDTDYALILSDMKMPGMDGPALLGELERQQPGLGRRVVFVTGDTLSSETETFLKARNTLVLSKPFDLVQVRAVVRQALSPSAAEGPAPPG